MPFPHVFEPLQLRHRTLTSRINFGAHTANMAEGGLPGERHIGYYRERLDTHQESAFAFNSGVGVKVRIFGPLMGRADYRVMKLRGDPLYSTVHRVYSNVHLAF